MLEITEAMEDEDKAKSLESYREIYSHYLKGNETLGVVSMYEEAALFAGWSHAQLSAVRMGVS